MSWNVSYPSTLTPMDSLYFCSIFTANNRYTKTMTWVIWRLFRYLLTPKHFEEREMRCGGRRADLRTGSLKGQSLFYDSDRAPNSWIRSRYCAEYWFNDTLLYRFFYSSINLSYFKTWFTLGLSNGVWWSSPDRCLFNDLDFAYWNSGR